MSLHEKIRDYNERCRQQREAQLCYEQAQQRAAEANRIATEKAERYKAGPLYKALTNLGVYNMLQSIRDEKWKEGTVSQEIYLDPGNSNGLRIEGKARAFLIAQWPRFVPRSEWEYGDSSGIVNAHIEEVRHYIQVIAYFDENGKTSIVASSDRGEPAPYLHQNKIDFNDPLCRQRLEDLVISDFEWREYYGKDKFYYGTRTFPYDLAKEKDEQEIVRQIKDGFDPGPQYSELAAKAFIQNPIKSTFCALRDNSRKF